MKRKAVLILFILLIIIIKIGACQNPVWEYGFQIKYGLAKFRFETLNKWIEQHFREIANAKEMRKFGDLSAGTLWDISFFCRPYKKFAFSVGFMPKFKAEKEYVFYNIDAIFLTVEAVPYYFSGYFYIPVSSTAIEPYIILSSGYLKNPKLHYHREYGKIFTHSGQSSYVDFNYSSIGLGTDLHGTKSFILTSVIGYQISNISIEYHRVLYDLILEKKQKLSLDFSGFFFNFGFRLIL